MTNITRKNDISLANYSISEDKLGGFHAYNIHTGNIIRGDMGLKIIMKEREYNTTPDSRLYKNMMNQFNQSSTLAIKIIGNSLVHSESSIGILLQLQLHSHFTSKEKQNHKEHYPKLFQLHMSSIDICKKFNVGNNTVNNLFNVLRHYGLAIIHYGNIVFSPLLFYKQSLPKKEEALKHYLKLLSKDKYGKEYLNNKSVMFRMTKLL